MTGEEIISLVRTELRRLLREDAGLRRELLDAIGGSTLELVAEELTRLRQDFSLRFQSIEQALLEHSRRFEVIEQRLTEQRQDFLARFEVIEQTLLEHSRHFEVIEQTLLEHSRRFEVIEQTLLEHSRHFEVIEQTLLKHSRRFEVTERTLIQQGTLLAEMRVGVGSLGGRMGRNLEESIRMVIERFSGIAPLKAKRLVLTDEDGEILHPGADVEFDALVTNGRAFLVEAKSYTKLNDVAHFAREAAFAERKLGYPVEKVIITLAAEPRAVELAKQMGIACYASSIE